jgi:membrane protein DedA with SNARE-associated domain
MIKMENIEPFETIYDLFEMLIVRYGAMGIAAAMFAESAGVPFASAIVLLTAGSMILRGSVSFWSIFWASTIGITLGSVISYLIGMVGSVLGRKMRFNYYKQPTGRLRRRRDSKLRQLWKRYGNFSIFMAQLWGFSRTFISFPAGAMHMNFYVFVAYTFLGGMLFSLVAIGSSLILTHTMGLTLRLLKTMLSLSPLLLLIPVALIGAVIICLWLRKRKILLTSTAVQSDDEESSF